MGAQESTPADQHGATAETMGDKVLNVVTAPLAACCSTRAPARASVLLNSKKGELPVCNAAYKGDLHELQALASQGPGRKLNAGEKDADDNTPLHWAAVRGHAKATEYLVDCDADVNFKNKDKDTPMHWACSGGNVEVIRLLLAAQADGLARNSDYTTPLHFAAADGEQLRPCVKLRAWRARRSLLAAHATPCVLIECHERHRTVAQPPSWPCPCACPPTCKAQKLPHARAPA